MTVGGVFLIIFCVLCYTGQNFFNKLFSIGYTGPEDAATPVFAAIYGIVVGVTTLVYNGFGFKLHGPTLIFGAVNGFVLFLFNLGAIKASRRGPYAFQSLVMLLGNTVLPLAFSILFWGDRMTAVKTAGIVVMMASFLLFNLKGLSFRGAKKGYFFWVGALFTSNGVYGILMDAQQRIAMQSLRNEMIITTFLVSAMVSAVYLVSVEGKGSLRAFSMPGKIWCYAVGSSVCAAAAVNTMMMSLSRVPVGILYTVQNGGVLIFSALLSAVALRERMTRSMIAGIAVAVVSLVLLSM